MLPVRYYIPPADVRLDLWRPAPSGPCVRIRARPVLDVPGAGEGGNIAWSYDRRFRDAAQIHGLISFFNERVDLTVNGVLQPRPRDARSRPPGDRGP